MSTKTYPGVRRVGPKKFELRLKTRDPRTDKIVDTLRVVEASSPSAAAAMRATLRDSIVAERAAPERMKLQTYATSWLRSKLPGLKASTRKRYADVLQLHILPAFGEFYVDAITHIDVLAWRDEQHDRPASINGRLRIFRTLMRDAVVELELSRDPLARVRAIREARGDDGESKSLSAEELRTLLEAANRVVPQWYPLFATLAMTGMRFGEASALKWIDVDEIERMIIIRRAQWRQNVDTTKTGSRRRVPLPDDLLATLRAHRDDLIARKVPGVDQGWVFPTEKGTLPFPGTLRKPLLAALAEAKITRRFTVHGFRHTMNNLLRQSASAVVARSIVGHTTEAMTEHYSHVGVEERRQAISTVLQRVARTTVGLQVGPGDPGCKTPR